MKTAAKIVKSIFRSRSRPKSTFKQIPWVQEKILKHQEDTEVKQITFPVFTVFYKRPYELLHTYREIFEREIYRFATTKPNPLIVDCGANIGLSVLYYKTIFPAATVIAFEPDSNNFQLLQQNTRQNKLQNVHLRQEAVWITNGTISFAASESEASHIAPNGGGASVTAIRFADFLAEQQEIDFLKMDIEGAEWDVIRDCAAHLPKINNLFLEYHGKVQETHKLLDLLQWVKEAGFSVYIKMAADQMVHPFVEKTLPLPYDVQLNLFCFKQ